MLDPTHELPDDTPLEQEVVVVTPPPTPREFLASKSYTCPFYTSDAADEP